ncbi:MAG: GNAT family N-acetyltransferase, partial [Pseudomonadales bacterium]
IGFCSYGQDGQVPGGDYSANALDIGLGMKPELTGSGHGKAFFDAILDFAARNSEPAAYRLTVADFNERAKKLYRQFGFRKHSEFHDERANVPYLIMIRDN